MAPRAPGVHTHEEWKGMAQPVGLVVEPVVLNRLGIFPESATTVLADWQQRLEQLLEDQPVGDQAASEQWLSAAPSFELFCQEVLAWEPGDLRQPEELAAPVAVHLDDYDEVLRPDWIVPEPSQGEGPLKAQLLVQELAVGTPFDALPKGADGRRSWEATPQQRLERLLKESEHPIGLLWNGVALRLVYAPRGESSGHLTFPLEPMTTVDGRPMLAALQMLLGPDRLFEGGASNTRLRPLMEQSRKEQNEVSTRLAEQVLEALWILLRGFDVTGLEVEDPSHIYGGLITVLLRLVFLLYAEDEELMPTDSLYGQHYSVGGLAQRLRQDRADYQNAMEGRRGAWATLLSLFRLVYDGGGSTEAYLPARHGDLFDPDVYPFLEGRPADTSYTDGPLTSVPSISDDVVEQVLTKLLLLDGQILSYRALDVEQIGSVYEGIMGFMVEKATGPSVGITYRPPRQKITITVVVNAEDLLAQPASKREKWMKDTTGVDLKMGDKVNQGVKIAATVEDLCDALEKRLSKHTPRGGFQSESLILQPTTERRRSGSHYTPRSLTEPIVAEAFRPWLERCKQQPTAKQILALKVCDPAMGSGAFLVAVCRFLAVWLVQAWERDGYPEGFRQEWDKDTVARRLISQSCLYGVDKNPFAVNLAKLSLWLVTLSKEQPFTFVDHALKCGDSLVGYSVHEIRAAMREVQLGFLDDQNRIYEQMGINRRESFAMDSLTDVDYDTKRFRLEQQIKATDGLRQAGDLMVAAFFAESKPQDRGDKQQVYLSMLSGAFDDEELLASIAEIQKRPFSGEKGIKPLHWDLEFPEVFEKDKKGFDVFVGNPPFIGNNGFTSFYPDGILDLFRASFSGSGGRADYVVYFFRRCFEKLSTGGVLGLISTNKICQGDTRESGLQWICLNGGIVFNAIKRRSWPGVASVVVSIVHISKGAYEGLKFVDGSRVNKITAFLLEGDVNVAPPSLASNADLTYTGVKTYSQSFLFDSCDDADTETPGSPIPLDLARRLCDQHPSLTEIIRPYTGAEEINASPNHLPRRYAVNLGQIPLDICQERWPELIEILERKIKPDRASSRNADVRAWPWWKYWRSRDEMFEKLKRLDNAIVTSASAVSHHMFSMVPAGYIFSQKCVVIASSSHLLLCALQSLFHEEWSRLFGTTQGASDALTYNATDVFCNYPFPSKAYTGDCLAVAEWAESFSKERSNLYRSMGIGPTKAYGRMHSPSNQEPEIIDLRCIHTMLNESMSREYGWDDLGLQTGYRLESLEIDEMLLDKSSPFCNRLETQDLFFPSAEECIGFESWYKSSSESPGPLKWRYCWPESLRDKILARLLALNAQRHEGEVEMGLHSKAAKKTAKTSGKYKSQKASSTEFQLTSEPYQTGLQLF